VPQKNIAKSFVAKRIEELNPSHDRENFDCGSEPLNQFLRQVARQHSEKGISRTFVMVEEDAVAPKPVLGFFALSACQVETEFFPDRLRKKLPRSLPAARLGRLAVAKNFQGQGLGSALLIAAFKRMLAGSESVGMAALFVDAKDDNAIEFYQHFGFTSLSSDPHILFLMRADIAGAAAKA
jgi:GNAT superfamily N-acetyltransferase